MSLPTFSVFFLPFSRLFLIVPFSESFSHSSYFLSLNLSLLLLTSFLFISRFGYLSVFPDDTFFLFFSIPSLHLFPNSISPFFTTHPISLFCFILSFSLSSFLFSNSHFCLYFLFLRSTSSFVPISFSFTWSGVVQSGMMSKYPTSIRQNPLPSVRIRAEIPCHQLVFIQCFF